MCPQYMYNVVPWPAAPKNCTVKFVLWGNLYLHYAWVSRLQIQNINLTRTGQFLMPTVTGKCKFVVSKPIKWKFNIQFWRKRLQQMSVLIRLCDSYLSSRHKRVLQPGSDGLQKSSGIFESHRKSAVIFRRHLKIFSKHRKTLENPRKFGLCEDENLMHLT